MKNAVEQTHGTVIRHAKTPYFLNLIFEHSFFNMNPCFTWEDAKIARKVPAELILIDPLFQGKGSSLKGFEPHLFSSSPRFKEQDEQCKKVGKG